MSLLLGYNTNGFAHHSLESALPIIAANGYRAVALTIDVHHAPLETTDFRDLGRRIREYDVVPVVETGARFYLDPLRKHRPTLMDDGRAKRVRFLEACVEAAAALGAPCVSLWSGAGDDWERLTDGVGALCEFADARGVDLAFEPEPGMLVDSLARFDELRARVPHPRLLLTLDVGHAYAFEAEPLPALIARYAPLLRNVHLDDHEEGVHDHLMFGEGGIDFPPAMRALADAAAERDLPATVELSRHSHDAVVTCRRAWDFLAPLCTSPSSS